jgi:hypothetical protein
MLALATAGSIELEACARRPNSQNAGATTNIGAAPAPAGVPLEATNSSAASAPTAPAVPTPTLAAAFAAAYPNAVVEIEAGDHQSHKVEFRPVLVQRVGPDAFALVSAGRDVAASFDAPTGYHAANGFVTITYLTAEPKLAPTAKPFLIEATKGGWGAPPDIHLLRGVSQTPMVELEGGYFDQGIGDDDVRLIALGPTPQTIREVSDTIAVGHSDNRCDIKGKIVPVTPDKAFDIQFSGNFHGREHFVLKQGRWTREGAEPDLRTLCSG